MNAEKHEQLESLAGQIKATPSMVASERDAPRSHVEHLRDALTEIMAAVQMVFVGLHPDDDVRAILDPIMKRFGSSGLATTSRAGIDPLRGLIIEQIAAIMPAVRNLASSQQQCDADGVMVKVSRQALCEVLRGLDNINSVVAPPRT